MKGFNIKVLEVNEKDNILTAMSKGLVEGSIKGTLLMGALAGGLMIVGKCVPIKGFVNTNKEDVGAE